MGRDRTARVRCVRDLLSNTERAREDLACTGSSRNPAAQQTVLEEPGVISYNTGDVQPVGGSWELRCLLHNTIVAKQLSAWFNRVFTPP